MTNENATHDMRQMVATEQTDIGSSPNRASRNSALRAAWSRIVLAVFALATAFVLFNPVAAFADVTIGGETLHGWSPSEMAQTDINVNEENMQELAPKTESWVVTLVQIILPLFAIACVVMIIYHAIRNIFVKDEEKVKMGQLLKNIFTSFFFILFAWIIVELIIFAVTLGESTFASILMS